MSNKDGKTLGLIVEVEQTASVRLVPSPELQPSSGETGGPAGLRPGPLARRISADALPLISEELPAGSHKGICVQDVRLNSLEYWPLYQTPPLLRPLHAFEVGTSVIKDGRLGAIVTCKVDYLVQLDSGHRFTLEYGYGLHHSTDQKYGFYLFASLALALHERRVRLEALLRIPSRCRYGKGVQLSHISGNAWAV